MFLYMFGVDSVAKLTKFGFYEQDVYDQIFDALVKLFAKPWGKKHVRDGNKMYTLKEIGGQKVVCQSATRDGIAVWKEVVPMESSFERLLFYYKQCSKPIRADNRKFAVFLNKKIAGKKFRELLEKTEIWNSLEYKYNSELIAAPADFPLDAENESDNDDDDGSDEDVSISNEDVNSDNSSIIDQLQELYHDEDAISPPITSSSEFLPSKGVSLSLSSLNDDTQHLLQQSESLLVTLSSSVADMSTSMNSSKTVVGSATTENITISSNPSNPPFLESSQLPLAPPVIADPCHEILELLKERHFEEAFAKAISSNTTQPTLFCCQNADVDEVIGMGDQPLLSQPILLCLMQTLGKALRATSDLNDLRLQMKWIQEIAVSLNPVDSSIKPLVPNVKKQVAEDVHHCLQKSPTMDVKDRRFFLCTLHMIKGMQLG